MTMMNEYSPQVSETMEPMKSVLIEDLPTMKHRSDNSDSPPPAMVPVSDYYGSDASSASGEDLHPVSRAISCSCGTSIASPTTAAATSIFTPPSTPCSIPQESSETAWSTTSNCTVSSTTRREDETANWAGSSSEKKRITWGGLEVRLYAIIPGDNPACEYGPSLTMDWGHFKELSADIDKFEEGRQPRKRDDALRMNWMERRRLLKRSGFREEEISEGVAAAKKVREQRLRTIQNMKFEKLESLQQSILKRVGRTFHPKVVLKTKY